MDTLLIIANIVGYIGFVLLYIQVIFGSRHIFKYFTKDTVFINTWHKTIGKYSIFAIFLHPLLSMMYRLEDLWWIIIPNWNIETEEHITFGRFALILFLVLWITSAIVREKIKWRPWKQIHLLAYPITILVFLHTKDIGTFYNDYLAIKFVWVFLFIILVFSIIFRLSVWSGLYKRKYILVKKDYLSPDIVLIELQPVGTVLESKIGQHFFLQVGRFSSEHPFSIIKNQKGNLFFGIRRVNKFWDQISTLQVGGQIYVDGPYGVFTKEAQNTKPKVLISGGIGVTPFIDLVNTYGSSVTYINCNRTIEEAIERSLLKSKSAKYVDILNQYTGAPDENIIVGQISKEILGSILGGDDYQKLPIFICGSPGFVKSVRNMCALLGVPKKNIYYEQLGF